MPKILIGVSILLITLAFVFGFLNTTKLRNLRNELVSAVSAREIADHTRTVSERNLRAREADLVAAQNKATVAEAKVTSAEAAAIKAQNEKAEIEAQLEGSENQIADLQKRLADATVAAVPGTEEEVSPNELKSISRSNQKAARRGRKREIRFGRPSQSRPGASRSDRGREETPPAWHESTRRARDSSGGQSGL